MVKIKALSPNADRGKADAVPRWVGQLYVAVIILDSPSTQGMSGCGPVLMAPEKAVQLPAPVRKEQKLNRATLVEPGPARYAGIVNQPTMNHVVMCLGPPLYIGTYPAPNAAAPTRTPTLGLRLSIKIPAGIPIAYCPTFPAAPYFSS